MNARSLIAGLASAAAVAGIVFAVAQFRAARATDAELKFAKRNFETIQTRLAEWETKAGQAGRRARDAERDTSELLKAVAAVKAQPPPGTLPARTVARPAESPPPTQILIGSNPEFSAEENLKLAQERAYQQELAKHRAQQAKERAQFDEDISRAEPPLTPAQKFEKMLARAEQLAANADFQSALRTFNEALALKPDELPLPDSGRILRETLVAQSSPVEVTLGSDGATFVSVANSRSPSRFTSTTLKMMPGDYEVVGRRPGFSEVRTRLQVRSGMAPPVVSVVCTQPVPP